MKLRHVLAIYEQVEVLSGRTGESNSEGVFTMKQYSDVSTGNCPRGWIIYARQGEDKSQS